MATDCAACESSSVHVEVEPPGTAPPAWVGKMVMTVTCCGSDCAVVAKVKPLDMHVDVAAKGQSVTSEGVAPMASLALTAPVGCAPGSPPSRVQEVETDPPAVEGNTVRRTGACDESFALGSSVDVGAGAGR